MSVIKIKQNDTFEDIPALEGAQGPQGIQGPAGEGIPTGGNENNILVKNSPTNYDTSWKSLVDLMYPIGSIYMSVSATSPATLFGGSWEKIEGRFLLGTDANYTLNSTGGEIEHLLTVDEMPSHTHNIQQREENPTMVSSFYNGVYDPGGIEFIMTEAAKTIIDRTASDHLFNSSTGGGQPHNNMPPYLAVNIWKRTA